MENAPARLVTARDVANHFGVSRATVYNLMARGLPSVKVGAARRFRLAEVDDWLAAQQATAAPVDAA